jgi:hypothetical protein
MKSSHELLDVSPEHDEAGPDQNHPTIEELGDYHEHRLSSADADRVQLHLVFCSKCMRMLLDLGVFLEEEPETADASEEEQDAAWSALKDRLRNEDSDMDLAMSPRPLADARSK